MTKNKTTLKMLADGLFTNYTEMNRRLDSIPDDEKDNNPWWYLHGQLEEDAHFDKATVINSKSAGYSALTVNWTEINDGIVNSVRENRPELIHRMHLNGEVSVEIEGITKPCTGFFWTSERKPILWKDREYPHWEQRGLVCYTDDAEACEYAREMMEKKSVFI